MDGPGTGFAFVICDQLAILCTPLEYWRATVFPTNVDNLAACPLAKRKRTDRYQRIFCPQIWENRAVCSVLGSFRGDYDRSLRWCPHGSTVIRNWLKVMNNSAYLHKTNIRSDNVHHTQKVGFCCYVYAYTKVGLFAFHCFEQCSGWGIAMPFCPFSVWKFSKRHLLHYGYQLHCEQNVS